MVWGRGSEDNMVSPSTMWVLGIKLKLLDLATSAFTHRTFSLASEKLVLIELKNKNQLLDNLIST